MFIYASVGFVCDGSKIIDALHCSIQIFVDVFCLYCSRFFDDKIIVEEWYNGKNYICREEKMCA